MVEKTPEQNGMEEKDTQAPNNEAMEPIYAPIFVARQPVFDRAMGIYAYGLVFNADPVDGGESSANGSSASLIVDGLSMVKANIADAQSKYFIPMTTDLLVNGAAHALPRDQVVLDLAPQLPLNEKFMSACHDLKQQGYALAIADPPKDASTEAVASLAGLADIFRMEMSSPSEEIIKRNQILKSFGCQIMAANLLTSQELRLAKTLGHAYFQGDFFSQPQIIPGRTLPITVGTKLQLLREIGKPDMDFGSIATIISSSISLSYRLLKYINSAARGMRLDITSIPQATANMGERPLKQWLMMVLLTDLSGTVKGNELSFVSIQRAKLLSLLGQALDLGPKEQDTLFMLGLFSKLDAILDMPMAEILAPTAINQTIKDALCGKNNGLTPWLYLANATEKGNWATLNKLLDKLGIAYNKAAKLHAEASHWAMQMTKHTCA